MMRAHIPTHTQDRTQLWSRHDVSFSIKNSLYGSSISPSAIHRRMCDRIGLHTCKVQQTVISDAMAFLAHNFGQ